MAVGQDNFNNLLPEAPSGSANVKWLADPNTVSPRNISAYFPNIGGVDARTTTIELITIASQGELITFDNASPVGVALDASGAIVAAAVNAANPGSGYAVNDTFDISGGTGGTGHVVAESGGVVSAIAIDNPGFGYSVSAGNATTATLGVGVGLEIDISVVGGSIQSGFLCFMQNLGAGVVTITPGSGMINGFATLILPSGSGTILFFDGTNWQAVGNSFSNRVNIQTGTSYTLQSSDDGQLVGFTNAGAISLSLDSTISEGSGFVCAFEFLGAGGGTLTPTSGTVNGAASVTLSGPGGGWLFFDGTNWWAIINSSISIPIPVASGGTGDITLAAHGVLVGEGTSPVNVTGAGTSGQVLTSNGASADPTFQSNPYDLIFTFAGLPNGLTTYPWITFTRAVTFPGNFSGASGKVLTNPTSTYAITVNKNGSSVGTISISTGGVFTFTSSGGSPVTVAANDYFTLTVPATDPTLADLMITLAGTR